MGFRFRRSVKICKGVRLNLSKSGISTSLGGKGFTMNVSGRGVRTTSSLPGTGLSYTTNLTSSSRAPRSGGRRVSYTPSFAEVNAFIDDDGKFQVQDLISGQPLEAGELRRFKRDNKAQIDALYQDFEKEKNAATNLIFELEKHFFDIPDDEDWIKRKERGKFVASSFDIPKPRSEDFIEAATAKAKEELKDQEGQGCIAGCLTLGLPFLLMISSVEALVEIGAILLFLIPFLAGAAYAMANGAYKKKLEDRTASLLDGLSKSELFSWEQRRSEHLKSQESRREEFEKSETTRLEGLEKLFLGDLDEIQAELERVFSSIDFYFEFYINFDVPDPSTVYLDIDLPEIEHIPSLKANLRQDGKVSVKDKSQKELSEQYARLCHSLLFWFAIIVFDTVPTVERVFASGYTQRVDKKTGAIVDDYVLAVHFDKSTMEELFMDRIDPLVAVENFDHRRKMTKTFKLGRIEPFGP